MDAFSALLRQQSSSKFIEDYALPCTHITLIIHAMGTYV